MAPIELKEYIDYEVELKECEEEELDDEALAAQEKEREKEK